MPDTAAKVRAKGLDKTGFTDKDADHAYRNLGARRIAIVELRSVQGHEDAEGKRGVDIVIDQLYPVPLNNKQADRLDEGLRTIMAALHQNILRENGDDEPQLDGMPQPASLEDSISFVKPFLVAGALGDDGEGDGAEGEQD